MTSTDDATGLGRRDFLRVGASAAVAGTAAAAASAAPAAAQTEFDYDGWFDDVPNFQGTEDRTGSEEVRVTVGPGGDLTFAPPAIHVDPGTTVVWEWDAGYHNVAEQGSGDRYASETVDAPGTTFSVTFEGEGVSTYVCEPHATVGMKGAVAVGSGEGDLEVDVGGMGTASEGGGSGGSGEAGGAGSGSGNGVSGGSGGGDPMLLVGGAGALALLSPLALGALLYRDATRDPESPDRRTPAHGR